MLLLCHVVFGFPTITLVGEEGLEPPTSRM